LFNFKPLKDPFWKNEIKNFVGYLHEKQYTPDSLNTHYCV